MYSRSLTGALCAALLTASTVALAAAPALAAPASSAPAKNAGFPDVPADHWAASAVRLVALEHPFMKAEADGSFRGDAPFTRAQLALAVYELIRELEAITHRSWATPGLGGYAFQDLPADPETRRIILLLANQYRLFEGVPGVTSRTFESNKQVTRYEMAKVVHRLMRLGESIGAVDPSLQKPQIYTFRDLPLSAWGYADVREVSDRYQVMIGFPDGTFRGPEELTRYQFAASASQTFPLVSALVARTQDRIDHPTAAAAPLRYMEATPWLVGAGHDGTSALGLVRGAAYFGSFFALGEAQSTLTGNAQGGLNVGYSLPLGGTWQLQPYLGAVAHASAAGTVGGLAYGAIAYSRASEQLGLYGRLQGTSFLGGSPAALNPMGVFSGRALAGAEYFLTPQLALVLEGGVGNAPQLGTGAAAPLATALGGQGTLGLSAKF